MRNIEARAATPYPTFELFARSESELRKILGEIDISVPLATEGQTIRHVEQYMMARFIATFADQGFLEFPLILDHPISRNEKRPDFLLSQDSRVVGVECVQAVPWDWSRIIETNEKDYPDQLMYGQVYPSSARSLSEKQRLGVARRRHFGKPWVGDMAKRNWVEAMLFVVGQKTKKLRRGMYDCCSKVNLLIHDEWPVPLNSDGLLFDAARSLASQLSFVPSCVNFEEVFICSRNWVFGFSASGFSATPIRNLW